VSARADQRLWGPSLFGIDTSVEAIDGRRFAATITDHWNGLAGRPLGGYVLAVCLRAMQQALPFSDPLVVSAFFLNPVDPGPVEIHIEAARAGRRSATAEARLCQHGVEALRSIATFTDLEHTTGQHLVVGSPPVLPAPDVAVDLHDGAPVSTASIAARIDYRVSQALEANRALTDGLHTKLWMRLKQGGTQDLLSLPMARYATPPAGTRARAAATPRMWALSPDHPIRTRSSGPRSSTTRAPTPSDRMTRRAAPIASLSSTLLSVPHPGLWSDDLCR
jgi:hypothetical protein